jgi:para-nitrobenzyl esterase
VALEEVLAGPKHDPQPARYYGAAPQRSMGWLGQPLGSAELQREGPRVIRRAFIAAMLLLAGLSVPGAVAESDRDSHDQDHDSQVAFTLDGPVQGTTVGDIRQFLGIPYAAAPTGDRRWRPPQPHARWSTPLDATHFGKHCPQPEGPAGQANASEDCLFLNVYSSTHERERDELQPVMVWIHGGSLVTGKSDDFDPIGLIERGHVVVVSINYRLGALGFLTHPALDAEGHKFANYGLMDQQKALDWVRRNIQFFGGDPDNVTIFGESAGGQSVTSHLTSPDSHGLFEHAIVQSGAYALTLPTVATAEAQGAAFAASVGCASQTAACLRATAVATLVSKEATVYITTQDGQVLPASPMQAFASGQFNRTPVIQGSNHDEYRLFVATQFDLRGGPLTAAAYPAAIAAFPTIGAAKAPQVVAEYPLANFPSADLAYATAIGDTLFSCSARRSNLLLSSWVPTFAYEFNDENAPSFLPPVSFPYGATHAYELSYLFKLSFLPAPSFTANQVRLANTMKDYWTAFARSGRPRAEDAPHWPRYHAQTDRMLSLVPPRPGLEDDFSSVHHCAFWRALSPAFD